MPRTRNLVVRRRASLLGALAAIGALGVLAPASDAATVNTAPPALSGTAVQGQTLTTSTGTWTGTGAITYAYRWQRCNPDGSACAEIAGETANTYTLGLADVGDTVRSVVTATDTTGSASAASAVSGVVAGLAAAAPAATAPPVITGTSTAGQTLTASTGTYTGATPISYAYQWERCDKNGATCVIVPGAVSSTFLLSMADIGSTIRVVSGATNASGATTSTSVPTAVIAVGTPASATKLSDGTTSIDAADVTGGERLTLDHFKTSVSQPIHSRDAFKITFHVSDTRGYSVRNALVYLIGLPYNRIDKLSESKTLQDGTVTFTVVPTKLQPLKVGARLVIFARARVPGDKLLTGASTRRLVEVVFGAPSS
jgi:hypothetical protein